MAQNVRKIADVLGAKVIAQVPETGGGAFGAARLAAIVAKLQDRRALGQGKRPGRPTDAEPSHSKCLHLFATNLSVNQEK